MHKDGLIVLPPPKWPRPPHQPMVFGPDTEPPADPAPTTLDEVRPLSLRPPLALHAREQAVEFVARYHYLGYKTLVGAQMRYAIHDRDGRPLAMLGFSTVARKLAPRDRFIGWTPQLREKNFPLVIDNPRFLILPWITIPNLGSHILSLVRRQLPDDWTERYNVTPVLIETFVETPRFTGALYKASGWIHVGTTRGRGRYDRHTHQTGSTEEGHLAPVPAEGLAAHAQSVRSWSPVSPCDTPSLVDRTKNLAAGSRRHESATAAIRSQTVICKVFANRLPAGQTGTSLDRM